MLEPHVELDLRDFSVAFHLPGERPIRLPFPPEFLEQRFPDGPNIERIVVALSLDKVVLGLPGGLDATVEIRTSRTSIEALRAERPVVYLDQNLWSRLDSVRTGRTRIAENEATAAKRLAEMVEAREVLLPVSSAHLVETAPLYDERRLTLASTELQLSRGWQMRNPVRVRADELFGELARAADDDLVVFAPQASGIFASESTLVSPPSGVASLGDLLTLLPSILAVTTAIVDSAPIPDEGGAADAAAWASNWRELALKLHAANEPIEMFRRVAGMNLILDARDSVHEAAARAGVPSDEAVTMLTADDDPVARMPFLAQMRQQLFHRLRNRTNPWEGNDLTDILFLSCAAGYADIVAGERRTIGYMRQARAPTSRARLATNLAGVVALLDGGIA